MATTYISRTPSSGGNRRTWTFSAWVKRGTLGARQGIYNINGGSNPYCYMEFVASNAIRIEDYNGSTVTDLITNRLFRDTSAWYHIVVAYDTTQSTNTNRIKLYINGVQETSFSTETYCAEDFDTEMNHTSGELFIGKEQSNYFDGLMSYVQLVDSAALAPTAFGSVDATTGEWKILASCYSTPGTNGFCLGMEDSTNLDLDSSSNGHTFSTSGTLTATKDCPSDVFCNLNAVSPNNYTMTNGNTKIIGHTSSTTAVGTICPNKGKWYWEVKLVSGQSSYPRIGIFQNDGSSNHIYTTHLCGSGDGSGRAWGSNSDASVARYFAGDNSYVTGASYTNGSIVQFAMDLDNGKLWFGKDNTWYGSGAGTVTIANIGNNTATPAFSDLGTGVNWTPAIFGNGSADVWAANFGNGYFGTTAISSAGTNASGIGLFEFDVPTNFTAISTKGLNA